MTLSLVARALLVLAVVAALLTYLLIVDLGISAGRIHPGVSVARGHDVGGMTEEAAAEFLDDRAELLSSEAIVLGGHGVEQVEFFPYEVGWNPRPVATARAAMAVGRKSAPFGALRDRVRAWVGGVEVAWSGSPNPRKVTAVIDDVEREVTASGEDLRRWRLRLKIRRAIVTWPRKPLYRIPVTN